MFGGRDAVPTLTVIATVLLGFRVNATWLVLAGGMAGLLAVVAGQG